MLKRDEMALEWAGETTVPMVKNAVVNEKNV